MKFGICNEIFQGWEIEAVIDYIARTGYDGLEIAPFTLAPRVHDISPAIRRKVSEASRQAGVEVCGLHWLLAKTEDLHLSHPDRSVRNRTSEYLIELVDCCADLGGKTLVLGSPKQRNILPEAGRTQAWEWATATVSESAQRASDRGLVICIEPLSPAETDFINTAAEAIRFAEQFTSPSVQIILDVKAMCSEPLTIPEIIRASRKHTAHFHANDRNLKGPGFGDVDFRPIAGALRETGYAGYVSVEVFNFDDGPEKIATASLRYLRECFRPMDNSQMGNA